MLRYGLKYGVLRGMKASTGYGRSDVLISYGWNVGTVVGFLHETSDTEVNNDVSVNGARQRGVFTMNTGQVDVQRGDVLERDGERWRVTSSPNREVNPFTGWEPTITVQVERLQG